MNGKTAESSRAAEQRVAAYFDARKREILETPLSEIAAACQVSPATVVRFCNHAGYKGLKDYKIALARRSASASSASAVAGDEDAPELIRRIFAGCVSALEETGRRLSPEALSAAIACIASAGALDVYATGGSAPVASYLRHQLMKLGIRASLYSDRSSMLLSQARFTRQDTVLAISSTGATQEVVEAQRAAKEAGAATLCITADASSPLAAVSDIVLIAVGEHFLGNNTYARLSQLAVVDALYAGLVTLRKKQ